MAENVGSHILPACAEWGVERVYGYPGDGINGIIGALPRASATSSSSSRCATRRWPRSWPAPTRSSPARSASAWRPPGRAPSTCSTASTTPSWTTSRWWRSSASRRATALGGDYQQEVDLGSLFKDVASEYVPGVHGARAGAPPGRPRHPHRARRAHGHLRHRPQRRPGGARSSRRRASTARSTPAAPVPPPRVVPHDDGPARAPPRCSTPAQGGDAGRPGRAAAPPTRSQVAELLGAGVAKALLGQARAARRPALRDRLDRAARHQAERGHDGGLRHAADGRLELPVLRVAARGGPGARRADRHRRRACSACATRWR